MKKSGKTALGCVIAAVVALVVGLGLGVGGYFVWKHFNGEGPLSSLTETETEDVTEGDEPVLPDVNSPFIDLIKKHGWADHDGGFRYPAFMQKSEKNVLDVPATVTTWHWNLTDFCYWPLIGSWAISNQSFPVQGCYVTSTALIQEITQRDEAKGVFSGTTSDNRNFCMKKKLTRGDAVDHVAVLVIVYPNDAKEEVTALIDQVEKW